MNGKTGDKEAAPVCLTDGQCHFFLLSFPGNRDTGDECNSPALHILNNHWSRSAQIFVVSVQWLVVFNFILRNIPIWTTNYTVTSLLCGYIKLSNEKAMAPHSSTLAWKNLMDGGAWWAAVHGVAKSRTRLSDFTFTFHFHALVGREKKKRRKKKRIKQEIHLYCGPTVNIPPGLHCLVFYI